ncbi:MAG TPA: hypothetical protein VHR66_05820 [Gemmataceae bacterium]|nr:hypothetical protein [Gemmataceae bacterium]
MRERFFDLSAWKRSMDGWRSTINGHTVDLVEGPPGYFTPIVDWLTNLTAFQGATCADLQAAIGHAWPLVAETVQRAPGRLPSSPRAATSAPQAGQKTIHVT